MAYFTASCDTAELNKQFAESLGLDYPILSDPSREVATKYEVVNATRNVPMRYTFFIGADGKILHIETMVKSGSHGADIAAKLKELNVPLKK